MAALESVWNERFNCDKCKLTYGRDKNAEKKTRLLMKSKGCFEVKTQPIFTLGDYKLSTCIGNMYNESILYWLRLWDNFSKGVMPFNGPIIDQPAKVMDVFDVIDSQKNKRLKQMAEEKKRNEKKFKRSK